MSYLMINFIALLLGLFKRVNECVCQVRYKIIYFQRIQYGCSIENKKFAQLRPKVKQLLKV